MFLWAISAEELINFMQESFDSIGGYTADFVEIHPGYTYRGTIRVKFPGRFRLDYKIPGGRTIVCDGRTLWIYLPSLKLAGEQKLKGDVFFSGGASLIALRKTYNISPAGESIVDGKNCWVALLTPKDPSAGFKKMKIYVLKDMGIPVKTEGETARGSTLIFLIKNIKKTPNLPNDAFRFYPPAEAQMLYDPFFTVR